MTSAMPSDFTRFSHKLTPQPPSAAATCDVRERTQTPDSRTPRLPGSQHRSSIRSEALRLGIRESGVDSATRSTIYKAEARARTRSRGAPALRLLAAPRTYTGLGLWADAPVPRNGGSLSDSVASPSPFWDARAAPCFYDTKPFDRLCHGMMHSAQRSSLNCSVSVRSAADCTVQLSGRTIAT